MAFEKRFAMLMVLMCISEVCMGAVYKVGDKSGWTDNGKVDYQAWSNSKTFRVGDTILFEYDNRFSNVVRVNHHDYNTCNNIHPYFSLNSGNDSFVIPGPSHYYFISGLPGHCETGQRVDIRVSRDTPTPAPSQSPSQAPTKAPPTKAPAPKALPPSSPQPPVPKASPSMTLPVPSPKKRNGAVSISGMWLAIVVAIAVSFYGFSY